MQEQPATTRRLTMAQALIIFLKNQYLERDGERHPFFAGCFGIFGHGNVAGIGQALAQMPADVREYTNCFDVIERQLFKQLGQQSSGSTGTGSTSSGSSFLPTWLIIVIVVLALAAITFGALALRRRGTPPGPGAPGGPDAPAGPGPGPGEGPPPSRPADSERPPPASGP